MPKIYRSNDGDRIDRIAYAYFKNVDAVPEILELNPGLALYEIIPAGIDILIPDVVEKTPIEERLWD